MWTDINERLPDKDQKVIFYFSGEYEPFAVNGTWDIVNNVAKASIFETPLKPTHWTPLYEPGETTVIHFDANNSSLFPISITFLAVEANSYDHALEIAESIGKSEVVKLTGRIDRVKDRVYHVYWEPCIKL